MNRLCLVALIGLPAVGKTTFCRYIMEMESVPFNVLHLCYDNLITYNPKNPMQYKEQRESLLKSLKEIIRTFKKCTNLPAELHTMDIEYKSYQHSDTIILCDDNHYYRSMRYKLFQISREHSIGYCQIYFKSDIKSALDRNSLRNNQTIVPNDVIVEMCNRLEFPNINNKWENNTLTLEDTYWSEPNFNNIVSFITQFLVKPEYSLQEYASKQMTPQSKVHELDLLMRKRIQLFMSSTKGQNKKVIAKNLNDKRKDTLKILQMDLNKKIAGDVDLNKYVDMLIEL